MQVIPVALLALAAILDLIQGVFTVIENINDSSLLPELGKWTSIGSTLLCIAATLFLAIFLILGKYSSKALGFGVTFLGAAMSAVFLAWTIVWFQ